DAAPVLGGSHPERGAARLLASGTKLAGRYHIVRFIAAGGMGEVYEAEDAMLGTAVALKTIRPEVAALGPVMERFRRETLLERRVTHPNVCRIFDLGHQPPGRSRGYPCLRGPRAGRGWRRHDERRHLRLRRRALRDDDGAPAVRGRCADFDRAQALPGGARFTAASHARPRPAVGSSDPPLSGARAVQPLHRGRPRGEGARRGKVPAPRSAGGGRRLALAAVVAVAVAGGGTWLERGRRALAPAQVTPSIAVLPFVNMGFGQGAGVLFRRPGRGRPQQPGQVSGLRVVARPSSFQFKGRTDDPHSVCEKLNVGNVLEGSVRKEGNKLRIAAHLIQAKDGLVLWSETYDRELNGVFTVQDDIARAVSGSLKVKLLGGAADLPSGSKSCGGLQRVPPGAVLLQQVQRGGLQESHRLLRAGPRAGPWLRSRVGRAVSGVERSGRGRLCPGGWGLPPSAGGRGAGDKARCQPGHRLRFAGVDPHELRLRLGGSGR